MALADGGDNKLVSVGCVHRQKLYWEKNKHILQLTLAGSATGRRIVVAAWAPSTTL
jgi:hypothetical protein